MGDRKRAVVTGASAGIGLAFARALASGGHDLVLVARRKEKLEEIAAGLRAETGVDVEVVSLDLARPGAGADLADALGERGVDLLVNNAGFGVFGPFVEHDRDRLRSMIDLNVGTVTDLCHRVVPGMRARGGGAIINVASLLGFVSTPYFAVYAATKAYVLSFSEALAAELEADRIHVMALCPGTVVTGFQAEAGAGSADRMPGVAMGPEQVVEAALDGLRARKVAVVPGVSNKATVFSRRALPRRFLTRMMRRMLGRALT